MRQGAEITTQRAEEFGIPEQQESESDSEFRNRVSGVLRDQGHIIEAHEAFNNALYDQDEDAMTGIIGAVAQTLHGVDYGSSGEGQVGDDIAAGHVVKSPKKEMTPEMAILMVELLGKR